jgi:hypothetical protein
MSIMLLDDKNINLYIKIGAWPNGIKLAAEHWLEQLLTQFVPRFDHQGEGFGPPFLDARLHAMRSDGVGAHDSSWDPSARGAEPSERIHKADPLHAEVLKYGRLAHDHTDQVVDEGEDGQCLQHACYRFTAQHIHRHGGLELRERGLHLPDIMPPKREAFIRYPSPR